MRGWETQKRIISDRILIKDQSLDGPRRSSPSLASTLEDIEIDDYFMSDNNGIIVWLHMDAPTVQRIMKETSRIPAKEFKVVPLIPEIARTRKKAVDSILLGYKRSVDESVRYLIKMTKMTSRCW